MQIHGVMNIVVADASDRISSEKLPPKAAIGVTAGLADTTASLQTTISEVKVGEGVAPDTLKLMRETDDERNTVYRLVNNHTGQVISQVPSQQVLNVESSIEQLLQQEMQKPKLDVKS